MWYRCYFYYINFIWWRSKINEYKASTTCKTFWFFHNLEDILLGKNQWCKKNKLKTIKKFGTLFFTNLTNIFSELPHLGHRRPPNTVYVSCILSTMATIDVADAHNVISRHFFSHPQDRIILVIQIMGFTLSSAHVNLLSSFC